MRKAPLQLEHGAVRRQRQRPQSWQFLGERLVDHALGGRVHTRVGHGVEPMAQLGIEVVEVAEAAGEEEVFADVTEWPLDFALRFGPIRAAGFRLEAEVPRQVDEASVVDDEAVGVLADHRGLHAVIEDLPRRATNRVEGGDMAAQDGLQVLVHDELRPDQPGEAEHHGEQPDQPCSRNALIPNPFSGTAVQVKSKSGFHP